MRIALVTTSFLPKIGGAEFVVHHLGVQWCRQGHEVCVFNLVSDEATQPDAPYAVRGYRLLKGAWRCGPHRWPYRWHAARQLDRLLRSYRPEFISAHFGYPLGIWMARLRPVPPFLITCHGPALNVSPTGPRQVYGIDRLVAESLNRSAGAVAISSHAREVMERIGVDPGRIIDIPNGADLDPFRTKVGDFDLRSRFGLPDDAMVILSVGRDSPSKGYDVALRAFAKVAAEAPRAHYVIVGKYTEKWRPLAHELDLGRRVVICETGLYGRELIGAYQQADLFVLPSVKELCPLVVPEAMAAGLAQVVTDVSGSQDMIRDGENGLVVPPGRVDELAAALLRLVNDAGLRERMGRDNLARSEGYSWERISRRYLEHAPPPPRW